MTTVITDLNCDTLALFRKGKVRNVYDFGDKFLMVATDRVSAFDYILPNGIPNKGRLLTQLSVFWFDFFKDRVNHHLISTDIADFPSEAQPYADQLIGRSMLVKKTELIEVECVVRGYLAGSGWKEYQQQQSICGHPLPSGLQQASRLSEPLFTPAYKALEGHDENISFAQMCDQIGSDLAAQLREKSIWIYEKAAAYCATKGLILADTKFEFGLLDGEIILIDEVLTSDSSRYWAASDYREGISPPSFDKQIVRDYLEGSGWDKQPPVPSLPQDVVRLLSQRYDELYRLVVG